MATWRDITIEKYERLATLQKDELTEIDLVAATVAILDGVTVRQVEEMPYTTLLLKARGLRFLQKNPLPSIVKHKYIINATTYIPTLNPADITTAQYIDFQVRASDAPEDLAGLLSIFLIPEGHKYNEGYSSDDVREEIFKYLPIEDGLGLSAFFFELWKKSIRRLLRENKKQYRLLKRKRNLTPTEKTLMESIKSLTELIEKAQRYL